MPSGVTVATWRDRMDQADLPERFFRPISFFSATHPASGVFNDPTVGVGAQVLRNCGKTTTEAAE